MKPSHSLIKSIGKSNHTSDLADKLGEVALDKFLSESILRDIPIIGSALTMLKAGNDIAAYFFAKKVIEFLTEVEKVPQGSRTAFLEKYCAEDSDEHLGEVTLMLLEKIDHPALSKMLGRAFAMMLKGEIAKQTFELYAYIIKNLDSYLIRQLQQFYGFEGFSGIDVSAAIQLSNYGLVQVSVLPTYSSTTHSLNCSYSRTQFGESFYEKIVAITV
jgi:hypothetical protein